MHARRTASCILGARDAKTAHSVYGSSYTQIRYALIDTFGEFPIRLRFDAEHVHDASAIKRSAHLRGSTRPANLAKIEHSKVVGDMNVASVRYNVASLGW